MENKDKALNCDICDKWMHIDCVKVNQVVYASIKKLSAGCDGIKWICVVCEKVFGKIKLDLQILLEKQAKMELEQARIENKVDRVIEDMKSLEKKVEKKEVEQEKQKLEEMNKNGSMVSEFGALKDQVGELREKYSDVLIANAGAINSENINTGSRGGSSDQIKVIQEKVGEAWEREKRKTNLVVFGMEETNDQQVTMGKIKEIMKIVGIEEDKVKYVGRVGRIVSGGKPRLVRIACEDVEVRRRVLKGSNKLRVEEGYERIYISQDLTKEQQAQDKFLRGKLREIRDTHREAKINNQEIIMIEGGNRIVLYPLQN